MLDVLKVDKSLQAQCDARTLRSAEEIKANASRHRAAQAHAKKEIKQLEKVAKPVGRRPAKK